MGPYGTQSILDSGLGEVKSELLELMQALTSGIRYVTQTTYKELR